MAAAVSNVGAYPEVFEHRSFRLTGALIAVLEDVTRGAEEGDAGLKSCAIGALAAGDAGAKSAEITTRHHREVEVIEDEDECFNAMGEMLAQGFSYADVAKVIQLGGGATHLLALERWCDLVRLKCNVDMAIPVWRSSNAHRDRRRCRRALHAMRELAGGHTHVSVLHVVYGWPDPFPTSLTNDARVLLTERLGREYTPLARYTDTVEDHRQAMVEAEALRVPDRDTFGHWFATRHLEAQPTGDDGLYEAHRAWADRCISSGDAIRHALTDPPKQAGESTAAYRERSLTEARARRDAFLTNVKLDANRMLTSASIAYQAAWLRAS